MYILTNNDNNWVVTQQSSFNTTNQSNIIFISDSFDAIAQYTTQNNIFNFQFHLLDVQNTNIIQGQNQKIYGNQIEHQIVSQDQEMEQEIFSTNSIEIIDLTENSNITKDVSQIPLNYQKPVQTNIQSSNCQYKLIQFEDLNIEKTCKYWIKKLGHIEEAYFKDVKVINYNKFSAILSRKFYTDGGLGQENNGGFAVIEVVNNQIVSQYYNGFNSTNSMRMEFIAILEVLESTKIDEHIFIGTDSLSAIEAFTTNLQSNLNSITNLKPSLKNSDLIYRALYYLKHRFVSFCFVKGHSIDKFNNHVDALTNLKREGNDDFPYLHSLKSKSLEFTVSYIQPYQINLYTILAKNKVFQQNFFKQAQYWVEKLTAAQKVNRYGKIQKIDSQQFKSLQIPKFFSYTNINTDKGTRGGVCIANCDKQQYLALQFYLTTKIRAQLYGLLVILLIAELDQEIVIVAENYLVEEILIKQRDLWLVQQQNRKFDTDLLMQVFFYSLNKKIFIYQRTINELNLKTDAYKLLQNEKQRHHDISFETLVEQCPSKKQGRKKGKKKQPKRKAKGKTPKKRVMKAKK